METVTLTLLTPTKASVAMVSLPWLDITSEPTCVGVSSQSVPLFDRQHPPPLKRYLVLIEADDTPLPSELTVTASERPSPSVFMTEVSIVPIRQGEEPFYHREDEARIFVAGREVGLRLGLWQDKGIAWWQWTRAVRLWSGAIAEAWRIGGHIPGYTVEHPSVPQWRDYRNPETALWGGMQLAADVFLIAWRLGVLSVTAHFKSTYFHYDPVFVPGLPVIALTNLRGNFPSLTLESPDDVLVPHNTSGNGGQGDALDLSRSALFFSREHPGRIEGLKDSSEVMFIPFADTEIVAHKTAENRLLYVGKANPKGFLPGVSRSIGFNVGLNGRPPQVARYRVPREWYGRCGVFNGQSQTVPPPGSASKFAARSRELIYQSIQRGGFDTGRIWRYLRRDLRSGSPAADDAEWDGTTPQALFLQAYWDPETADWDAILHAVYHFADIAVHHGHFMVRCHGYPFFHAPMPMMRVGGLVLGYAETGDPYLFETARAVADTFMAMHTHNFPRHSIGRDAFPLQGLMTLYDYTGDRRYLDFGRECVQHLLATQNKTGSFLGQGGVGVVSGGTNRWDEETEGIGFGSGLLSPIAVLEWALRDKRHPQGFADQMLRWYELVLRLQTPDGFWAAKPGAGSYPLMAAGLLFSLSAHHRLFGDARGLLALERYLAYADKKGEFVSGTRAFLALLYAPFFEMERTK